MMQQSADVQVFDINDLIEIQQNKSVEVFSEIIFNKNNVLKTVCPMKKFASYLLKVLALKR